MTFRIARIDPSRGGGIIETRAKLWDFGENIKSLILVEKLEHRSKIGICRIFLYKIAKVASVHWPKIGVTLRWRPTVLLYILPALFLDSHRYQTPLAAA